MPFIKKWTIQWTQFVINNAKNMSDKELQIGLVKLGAPISLNEEAIRKYRQRLGIRKKNGRPKYLMQHIDGECAPMAVLNILVHLGVEMGRSDKTWLKRLCNTGPDGTDMQSLYNACQQLFRITAKKEATWSNLRHALETGHSCICNGICDKEGHSFVLFKEGDIFYEIGYNSDGKHEIDEITIKNFLRRVHHPYPYVITIYGLKIETLEFIQDKRI